LIVREQCAENRGAATPAARLWCRNAFSAWPAAMPLLSLFLSGDYQGLGILEGNRSDRPGARG
jgi:hypothetical protein